MIHIQEIEEAEEAAEESDEVEELDEEVEDLDEAEEVNETETTFVLKDNSKVSGQYVLGTKESTSSFQLLGKILYVLQSKWGFLFIVVFPLFLAFIYEIYAIYKEVKNK